MSLRTTIIALGIAVSIPFATVAQSADQSDSQLHLELNAVQDTGNACRLIFVARNETGAAIEKAVFETVVFDALGGVVTLSLFDFRDLPADRPRVRQFDLPGMTCDGVGQTLINGANTCIVDGADSPVCQDALSLSSRVSIGLIG
ncbi:MAG: hypothetical protein AB3N23_01710 [Paracoccaceae bacterium]